MENLWDLARLSQYLGIKRSTLYAMIERGEIPFYRFGRLIRFSPTEIEDWLQTKRYGQENKTNRRVPRRHASNPAIDLVKAVIDEVNPERYNRPGKSDRIKGLRKEG